jgi:hypothetical protein
MLKLGESIRDLDFVIGANAQDKRSGTFLRCVNLNGRTLLDEVVLEETDLA